MSAKNLDKHNRWRNKTVAFRVSPEEDEQLEIFVKLSGLTKQDYITRRLLEKETLRSSSLQRRCAKRPARTLRSSTVAADMLRTVRRNVCCATHSC